MTFSSNQIVMSILRPKNNKPPHPNIFCQLPAMFPRAQTACSLMCWWGDVTRPMKAGMAPPPTTAAVWSDVPEAMLVKAQEASNWIGGQSFSPRKPTNLEIRPALMIWSMGGCLSRDSSFLHLGQYNKSESLSQYCIVSGFAVKLNVQCSLMLFYITVQPA